MKFVKKLTALFLAIVMTMAMGITAFAATTDPEQPKNTSASSKETVEITIKNPVADHEYEVYQLLTGDVVFDKDGNGKISNEVKGTGTDKTAAEVLAALKDSSGSWLSGGALSTAANSLLNSTKVDTLSTNRTSTSVTPGYYVIVDKYKDTITGDNVVFSRNMVAVVGDTNVTIKIETPSLDKKIVNPESDPNYALDASTSGKTDTAAIGDVINYEIKGSVPNYDGYNHYYYVINDTLSTGLTFDADSVKVYVGTSTTPLTKDTDYYLYTGNQADGKTFQIAFANIKNYTVGDEIKVTYDATLNENAVTGTSANTNTVNLTYSNNPNDSTKNDKEGEPGKPDSTVPTGKTPDKKTKTYTTELKLIKVDENNTALSGAEFTLTGTNLNEVKITTGTSYVQDVNGTYWKLKDGSYTTDDPATESMDTSKYESTTVKYSAKTDTTVSYTGTGSDKKISAFVGADGTWTFTGLNVGEYTLEETKVPAGYNKAANVKFEIKAEETGHADAETEGGNISWSVTNDTNNDANVAYTNGQFVVTVKNLPGSILPTTGGMGTTVIYIAGIAMIVAAGIVVIARKRMA